ncbi:MAG: hypothetical protein ACK528_05185, partial [Alphaproteobacteria bacterium]
YALLQGDTQAAALYAEGNDEGCAVRCSAIAPPIRQPVDAGLLMDACMSLGIWQRLEAAAPPGSIDPPASTARTMMTRLSQGRPVNLDNPAVQGIVTDCITHGLITQPEAEQLSTLADSGQTITQQQVGAAREWHRVSGGATNGVT